MDRIPGIWNRLGLVPIFAGGALLVWTLVSAIRQSPEKVKLGISPTFLVRGGPYAFTRNPMYLGELGLWIGWAIYYGSAAVLSGWGVFLLAVSLIVLPREERTLEAAFGGSYRDYKARVRRWL